MSDVESEPGLKLTPPVRAVGPESHVELVRGRLADSQLEAAYQSSIAEMPRMALVSIWTALGIWLVLAFADPWMGAPGFTPYRLAGAAWALVGLSLLLHPAVRARYWRPVTLLAAAGPTVPLATAGGLPVDVSLASLCGVGLGIVSLVMYTGLSMSVWNVSLLVMPALGVFFARLVEPGSTLDPGMRVGLLILVPCHTFMAVVIGQYLEVLRRHAFIDGLRIEWERHRSDLLLANVLPQTIASQLRAHRADPAHHPDVTVLFADLVGFTVLSAEMEPAELVGRLDRIFSAFDAAANRHGVVKVKTIGDAYMAVAGAPTEHEDPVCAMARFALELPSIVGELEGDAMEIRVGLHRGPVSAGVIGTSRFAWDLWGDTVNTASRMESHGLPGRIQVTAAVVQRLGDRFEVEPRGTVEVKGKGSLETWFLTGERVGSELPQSGN